ncbi:HNH endonuclease signature motif containing protein [Mycolicibacterium sp.]|uniref:HNH endonuclease signature motif containing protein n=1 Tax=Mycolicibacterium sp. TaxID=2320850 RepID=UPI0028B07FAA|nr:HNH endonuclease signature motif containing protein [Mycolicibacterium sp.]
MPARTDHAKLRGRSWRVLKDEFRKRCREVNARCWICDQQINYQAKFTDPASFEADHVKPVSTHPQLALIMGNLRPSHQSCNRGRGARPIDGAWTRADWS